MPFVFLVLVAVLLLTLPWLAMNVVPVRRPTRREELAGFAAEAARRNTAMASFAAT